MISHKFWLINRKGITPGGRPAHLRVTREGWFLFGFLPLYVRDIRLEVLS